MGWVEKVTEIDKLSYADVKNLHKDDLIIIILDRECAFIKHQNEFSDDLIKKDRVVFKKLKCELDEKDSIIEGLKKDSGLFASELIIDSLRSKLALVRAQNGLLKGCMGDSTFDAEGYLRKLNNNFRDLVHSTTNIKINNKRLLEENRKLKLMVR